MADAKPAKNESPKDKSPQAKKAAVKASGATREDRRAALRAQQLKQQQAARRNKQLKVGALVLAILLVVGVATFFIVKTVTAPKSVDKPQHRNSDDTAITIYADKAKQGVKTVTVYQDFQCPGCKSFDTTYGQALRDMAKAGDIRLEIKTLTFLDQNLPGSNKASYRAGVAAACVDATTDKYFEYFTEIYANQPEKEGTGYTDDQLKNDFPKTVGIAGGDLDKFQKCYSDQATKAWVTSVDTQGEKALSLLYPQGQFSTPSVTVNGKLMDLQSLKPGDPTTALKAAIDATA